MFEEVVALAPFGADIQVFLERLNLLCEDAFLFLSNDLDAPLLVSVFICKVNVFHSDFLA